MRDADGKTSRTIWARLLPAPADFTFLLVAFSAAVLRGWQLINTDGDLGRHLRVGREILAHGLFHTDRFSWTMRGQPFVPYEWGSEVLFSLAHRVAGLPGVVAMTAIVIALAYWCLNLLLDWLGVDPLLAFGTSLVAAVLGAVHWLARPHVFSLAAVVGVVWLLEVTSRKSQDLLPARPASRVPRPLWALGLFAIWANLHGGFLYGLVLIGFYIAGDLLDLALEKSRRNGVAALKRHSLLLLAALAGCCLNPSGPAILPHVMGYLGKTWLVDMTAEYRSPDFHTGYGKELLVVLLLTFAVLALLRCRMRWPQLVAFLGTTAFALHSVRNVPLWALTGLPLVALHAGDAWRRLAWRPVTRIRATFSAGAALARPGVWTAIPTVGLVGLALGGGRAGGLQFLPSRFDPDVFPVRVVEQAQAEGVRGRMFNELAWGGYILNAWPEQKVFIDGQTDLYGVPLSQLYMSIRQAEPGWERRLDSLGVTMVLVPDDAPVAWELTHSPHWIVADSADGAARFARAESSARLRPDRQLTPSASARRLRTSHSDSADPGTAP